MNENKSGKPELDAAIEFLEQECKSYEPFTPHGLNKLPHVLFESVGKAMVNYSAHENRAAQARIAELEAQHQWMDCKHKMPEKGVEVLVWSDRYGRTFATHVDSNKHGDIWQFDGEPLLTFNSPTHWMPLPKKPQP